MIDATPGGRDSLRNRTNPHGTLLDTVTIMDRSSVASSNSSTGGQRAATRLNDLDDGNVTQTRGTNAAPEDQGSPIRALATASPAPSMFGYVASAMGLAGALTPGPTQEDEAAQTQVMQMDTPALTPPGSAISSEANDQQEEDGSYANEMESEEVNLDELNPSSPEQLLEALQQGQ